MRASALLLSLFAVFVALAALTSEPARASDAADWLAGPCSGPNGTIRVRPHGRYVSGYFGTLVADALVHARERPDMVAGWMQWYFAHAHDSGSGVDGVPDDVDLDGDREVSRGRPDSTDAYGAVFLSLARHAYDSGDPALRALVLAHRDDLARIMDSGVATMRPNGLTWARPQYHIFYTIDDVELYRGLVDASALFDHAFHDAPLSARYDRDARIVQYGVTNVLWDAQTQTFRPYMNDAGTSGPANLSVAYPDALAQVLAIYYGFVDPRSSAARALLERASPALLAQNDPLAEHQLILLATQRRMGLDVAVPPFHPPSLCVDAAWYLQAAK
ncbi:MAG TPA: hypothetical protein VFN49_10945 [Candidatus Aquilonibacter sp.]|nr:hypothetical protein [Candidatus Aquilonibacter sp.]